MSVDKGKGPIYDPGLCRCCGAMKKCRVLNVEYQCMGQKEIYSDMFIDCYGIMLSHLDGKPSSRLVCATCVSRLREALAFRAQVLRCEAAFQQVRMAEGEEDNKSLLEAPASLLEVEIKVEPHEPSASPPPPPAAADDSDAEPAEPPKAEAAPAAPEPPRRRVRPKPPPKPSVETVEEPRISAEDAAELKKHRVNVRTILECSNATPIRCFSGVGYKCCYCKDLYTDPKDLKAHTLTKHDVKTRKLLMQRNLLSAFLVKLDITQLKCQLCDVKVMNTVEELMEHLMKEHEKKLHTNMKSHVLPFKFDDGLKCVVCTKLFAKFRTLQEHMNVHFRNYICDICEAGYPMKKMLIRHLEGHKTGVFACGFCEKRFDTDQKKNLHEQHVHIHAKSNYLNKCGVCGERFRSYRAKELHMLESHGVSSAVKCQACDRTYKNQRLLSIHTQRDHLMRRPHKCTQCDMAFYERRELDNHLVKHTGCKEFRCEVCLKAYGRKKTLREHMRIHLEDKRFKCERCGMRFVQKCSWRAHMRSKHTDLFVG